MLVRGRRNASLRFFLPLTSCTVLCCLGSAVVRARSNCELLSLQHCLAVWPPSGAITLRVNVWPRKQLKTNKLLASTVQQPAPYAKRLPPTCPAVRVLARGRRKAPRRPRSPQHALRRPLDCSLRTYIGLASVLHAASKHAAGQQKNRSVTPALRLNRPRALRPEAAVITAIGHSSLDR